VHDAAAQHARVVPAHVLVAEPLRFEPPGAAELRHDGAPEEGRIALAEARAGTVLGRADAHVMAAQVLGEEVLVEHEPHQDAREPLHGRSLPVHQLVRHHDARVARRDSHQQEGDEAVHAPEVLRRRHPHEQPEIQDLQREERQQDGVEGPARQRRRRLALLGRALAVGEDRSDDDEQPGERAEAPVRCAQQEAEGGEREHEAKRVECDEPRDFERGGGGLAQRRRAERAARRVSNPGHASPHCAEAAGAASHTKPYASLLSHIRIGMSRIMIESPTPRHVGKRETREALILAGIAELAEQGLAEPSLDAICARAGFTRGAFYVHFEDRDDFIGAVMERVLGGFLDAIIATGNHAHDLAQTVERFTDDIARLASGAQGALLGLPVPGAGRAIQFHRLIEACTRSARIRERWVALVREAIERVAKAADEGQVAGSVRSDIEAEQLGTLLVALALGAVASLDSGVPFDPARARDAVLALLRPPRTPTPRRKA
jgi:TetR/AcrR family transcriptional repressor of nem operon